MSSPIVAPPLSGNVLGSISNAFVVAEWQDAGSPAVPPRLIAPRHLHHSDDEAWYVLEGVLRIQVGTDEIEVPAGSACSCHEERHTHIGIRALAEFDICSS